MKRYFWNKSEGFVVFERNPHVLPDEPNSYKLIRIFNKGSELVYQKKDNKDYDTYRLKYGSILAAFLEHNNQPVYVDNSTGKLLYCYEEDKVSQSFSFFRKYFFGDPKLGTDVLCKKNDGYYCVNFQEVETFIQTQTSQFSTPQPSLLKHNIPRKQEVDKITAKLLEYPLHIISGEHGMGKTTLSKTVAQKMLNENLIDHIVFATYSNSIADTIKSIHTYALPIPSDNSDKLSDTLSTMALIAKSEKGLIIIDNYDNDNFEDELTENNETYRNLLDTGWYIIITSTQNLFGCSYIGTNQFTKISKLPLSALTKLFSDISGIEYDNPSITYLIDKLLLRNTYLAVLSAVLAKTESIDNILEKFNNNEVKELYRPIKSYKDGKLTKNSTIYKHFCSTFNMSDAIKSPEYAKLLFNLALLPTNGTDRELFFSTAFQKEDRSTIEVLFENLKDRHLAFENNNIISIHPMLKEYILIDLEDFDEEYIKKQILNILNIATYTDLYPYWYYIGMSLEKVEDKIKTIHTKAYLQAGISALRNITAQNSISYYYAKKAVTNLNSVNRDNLTCEELFTIAKTYNICANVLPSIGNEPSSEDKNLMISAIKNSKEILNNLIEQNYAGGTLNKDLLISISKLTGNLGAYYIRCKEYSEALKYHEITKEDRLKWYNDNPSKENELLLAVSYKNIGTDYYYLSIQESNIDSKLENLKLSYCNHTLALKINEKHLTVKHIDTIISLNRTIGTYSAIMLLAHNNNINPDSIFETITQNINAELYSKLLIANEYLLNLEIKNKNEIENISNNFSNLQSIESIYGYSNKKSLD